jgi:hypothetical protein
VLPVLATIAAARIDAGELTAGFADAFRGAAAVALAAALIALVALRRADVAPGTSPAVGMH